MRDPEYGERVRVRCSATGRYLGEGLALIVSAQDNSLFIDQVAADWIPELSLMLPVPTNRELEACNAGRRYRQRKGTVA